MSADPRTLAAYEVHAGDYSECVAGPEADPLLRDFIAALPAGARVLDLGCGPGHASAHMRRAGLDPDPVDASPAMVELANARHGIGARLASFDEVEAEAAYDAVWANFTLLHARRADLPRHLAALKRALRPGGLLHIAMKTGTGEARDRLGRFYTYVTCDELRALLTAAGFRPLSQVEGAEKGLAGSVDPFVAMRAGA